MKLPIFLILLFTLVMTQPVRATDPGIGWIASWQQGLAEARQTNKPIMLMAGAPACGGVPGVW